MNHNKKGNVGLIIEGLVNYYVKSILEGQDDKAKKIFSLIVKYFNPKTQLAEELDLYNTLLYTPINSFETGSKLLTEVKNAAQKLNEDKIKDLKFKLVLEIYEVAGKEFFNQAFKNYKGHASVAQLVNDYKGSAKIKNIKDRILLEEEVISNLIDGTHRPEKKFEMAKHSRIVEAISLKKFVSKYEPYYTDEEKETVRSYMTSKDFFSYAKGKLDNIKQLLNENKHSIKDEKISKKLEEALLKIDECKNIQDKNDLAYNLMLYQELIEEIKKIN